MAVYTVKGYLVVNEAEHPLQRRVPLQRLLQSNTEGCYLIRTGAFFPKSSLLIPEMWVYNVPQAVQAATVEHFPWDGQQRDTSVVGVVAQVAFLGEFDQVSFIPFHRDDFLFVHLHKVGMQQLGSFFHIELQCFCRNVIWTWRLPTLHLTDGLLYLLFGWCPTFHWQVCFCWQDIWWISSKCSLHLGLLAPRPTP